MGESTSSKFPRLGIRVGSIIDDVAIQFAVVEIVARESGRGLFRSAWRTMCSFKMTW